MFVVTESLVVAVEKHLAFEEFPKSFNEIEGITRANATPREIIFLNDAYAFSLRM
jgi:hypothetical protein